MCSAVNVFTVFVVVEESGEILCHSALSSFLHQHLPIVCLGTRNRTVTVIGRFGASGSTCESFSNRLSRWGTQRVSSFPAQLRDQGDSSCVGEECSMGSVEKNAVRCAGEGVDGWIDEGDVRPPNHNWPQRFESVIQISHLSD